MEKCDVKLHFQNLLHNCENYWRAELKDGDIILLPLFNIVHKDIEVTKEGVDGEPFFYG